MTDIVERLRAENSRLRMAFRQYAYHDEDCRYSCTQPDAHPCDCGYHAVKEQIDAEATDEIERLRAENAKLRGAGSAPGGEFVLSQATGNTMWSSSAEITFVNNEVTYCERCKAPKIEGGCGWGNCPWTT